MKKLFTTFVFCLLLAVIAFAQTPAPATVPVASPPAEPAVPSGGMWDVIKDPGNIAAVAFVAANLADAHTDWHLTMGGRAYVITPAQRVGIAGGGVMAALALKYYLPKTSKPINAILGVATAYFAGRALANTNNHGDPAAFGPVVPAVATAPKIAFAVRLH